MFLVCHFCHQHLLDKFHLSQILQMCLLAKFGSLTEIEISIIISNLT